MKDRVDGRVGIERLVSIRVGEDFRESFIYCL